MPNELTPEPGVLLIAPPMMHDPNFRRTVVLICEHNSEGTFGLILNRPLTVHLAEVLQGIGNKEFSLLQGGPVQTDTLHFLHTCGDLIPEAIQLANGVFWGGEFDILKVLIVTGEVTSTDVRFFLGYAGWSPGQLTDEIDLGGWILAPGLRQAVFDAHPSELWRKVLRSLGEEYAVLR